MSRFDSQLQRLDTARGVLKEMLRHRGYEVVDDERLVFQSCSNNTMLKVFFCCYSKLNIERIKAYIQELEEMNIQHCILVYDDIITSSCKKILDHMVKFTFETFHMDELQYDLTRHILYRPHEKLTPTEVASLDVKKFPILLKSDSVARYHHFQKGDVIRIRRKDGIIVYRVVR